MSRITNILYLIIVTLQYAWAQKQVCNQDLLDRSFVTQCGPSLCEEVLEKDGTGNERPNEWPTTSDQVVQVVSSREGDRLKVIVHKAMDTNQFYYEESHVNGSIFIDTEVKYQRVLGFGTTITDASCVNVNDVPNEIRDKLIRDYFSTETGIGLNLIKVPIGSTKYSYTNYVLDQPDANSVELSPYDIDHRIPIIKDAMKAAGKFKNRIKILASSTTAPPELKRNNMLIRGGRLKSDKYNDYAKYLAGFMTAYKDHGLSIWSLILSELPVSVEQNKEVNDTVNYSSMSMQPSDSIKLIRGINELRTKSSSSDAYRLLILGDNRAHIPVWADALFGNSKTKDNVAGIAYVCDRNKFAPYDNLEYLTRKYPNKYLLAMQGSVNAPVRLGNWQYAENYATEMVKNLEYGSIGWVDFNMALNLHGGPCIDEAFAADASVMVDPKRGVFYRNPMFYAIGHLSRYVKPGSTRVKINFYSSAHMYASQYIAFVTPDNYLVVFVMNNNIGPMPVNIGINTRTKVQTLLDTKSFNTFIFRL